MSAKMGTPVRLIDINDEGAHFAAPHLLICSRNALVGIANGDSGLNERWLEMARARMGKSSLSADASLATYTRSRQLATLPPTRWLIHDVLWTSRNGFDPLMIPELQATQRLFFNEQQIKTILRCVDRQVVLQKRFDLEFLDSAKSMENFIDRLFREVDCSLKINSKRKRKKRLKKLIPYFDVSAMLLFSADKNDDTFRIAYASSVPLLGDPRAFRRAAQWMYS